MKICKSALDATIEEFTLMLSDGTDKVQITEHIIAIIQAYSERLPDLVGALGDMVSDRECLSAATIEYAQAQLAAMEK